MNTSTAMQQQMKTSELIVRCRALLEVGDRVAAVKLYRVETKASLPAAMRALGLK